MKQTLWNKNFTLFFISDIQASFGASLSGITLAFLVLKLTNSPSSMSVTLALKYIPYLLTPIMATFLDRVCLKSPMIISNFFCGIILMIVSLGVKIGFFHIYTIYNMVLLSGFFDAIYGPATQSLLPNLVPKKQIVRGYSLLSMANQVIALVGLIWGGVMVTFMGPEFSLFIEGICYLITGLLLFFVCMPIHANANLKNSFYQDFKYGIKVMKISHVVLIITIMGFLINMFAAPVYVLLPVHMVSIGKGAIGYGFFMGLFIGGLLLGNITISILGARFNCLYSIMLGWLGISIAYAGLGLYNSFFCSLCWAFLLGVNVGILNTGIVIMLQIIIPMAFKARAFGILGAAWQMGRPASLFILSYFVNKVTIGEIFIFIMILSFIFFMIWLFTIKRSGYKLLLKPIEENLVEVVNAKTQ